MIRRFLLLPSVALAVAASSLVAHTLRTETVAAASSTRPRAPISAKLRAARSSLVPKDFAVPGVFEMLDQMVFAARRLAPVKGQLVQPFEIVDPVHEVLSDDRLVRLFIPELPSGLRISDIKMTKLAEKELPLRMADGSAITGYRLEPDGTHFPRPVTLTMRMPSDPEGAVPQVLVYSKTEGLGDPKNSAVTLGEGKTEFRGDISHFSDIISRNGAFKLTLTNPRQVGVGQTLEAVAVVTLVHKDETTILENGTKVTVSIGSWDLDGILFGNLPVLHPSDRPNTPPPTRVDGPSFTAKGTFTCMNPGETTTRYDAGILQRKKVTFLSLEGDRHEEEGVESFVFVSVTSGLHCLAATSSSSSSSYGDDPLEGSPYRPGALPSGPFLPFKPIPFEPLGPRPTIPMRPGVPLRPFSSANSESLGKRLQREREEQLRADQERARELEGLRPYMPVSSSRSSARPGVRGAVTPR